MNIKEKKDSDGLKEKDDLKEKFIKMGEGKDKCIICWKETEYDFDTPIQKRKYYVEGAGQLCERCYYLLYYGMKRK